MQKKIFLLLYLSVISLFASPLDLNKSNYHIGKHLAIYEDLTAELNLEHILKLPRNSFASQQKETFSSPFSSSAFWYRFEVNNTQKTALTKLFIFEPAWLDFIEINIISPTKQIEQYLLGDTFYYSQRGIDNPTINQRHSFEPGNSIIYIKVKTRDPFIFTISILDEPVFLSNQNVEFLLIGLLYGALFAMVIYNLFLFFGIREPYYAYYVLFVTSFIITNSIYNGYTFKLFFHNLPNIQNWLSATSIFFFSFSLLLFTQSFLNLKKSHIKLNILTNYIILTLILTAILSAVLGGYRYHIMLSIICSIIISSYVFYIAIYSWLHSNPTARFFLLGTVSGLIGTIITAITVMGLISYSNIAFKAIDIGMLIDAILLSLALADRIRFTQKERIKAEEETKAKSTFLSNMSHEIRTPMNAIMGMSNLALQTNLDKKQRNFIEVIDKSAKTLLDIINDILDFSKIEAGKLTINKIDFNLVRVINEVINLLEFKAHEKDIKLKVKYEPEFNSNLYGDSLRIHQILTNLISNAIKFTDKGEINIDIHKVKKDRYRFEIRDSGIGITQKQQEKLFQSFSQADTSTTRNYGGTGLGLAISKQLVELMNGKIWVESEIGKGSKFIFEIDLKELDNTDTNDTIEIQKKSFKEDINILNGKKILLAEDNKFNQDVIIYLLEESGIIIEIANNGQEAINMFNNRYDLILMDIQMPIMDGYEATKIIREQNKHIPIIALSANAMKENIQKSKNAGINEHLTKPINFELLYEMLLKYIVLKK